MAYLTGDTGTPDFSRAPILDRADTIAKTFDVDVDELLTGRAALMGTRRAGQVAAGGATRLLRSGDGWVALSLSRQSDIDSLGALLSSDEPIADPWSALERSLLTWRAGDFVERAQMLEVPAAELGSVTSAALMIQRIWQPRRTPDLSDLLVVDLSAMWAGPLCGHLLHRAGATVIKVESPDRPDGARSGNPAFFAWMNGNKLLYPGALRDPGLAGLLDVADVVIEASRPRALEQAGLDAPTRAPRPGRVWVRITGYGTAAGVGNRVAFGDDAAVAGGLVGQGARGPVFCGDAIADPLTGLEAAGAVMASLERGGGELIDVAMAGVAAQYAKVPLLQRAGGPDIEIAAPRRPRIETPTGATIDGHDVAQIVERRRVPC
jgi:hypothetical protein